MPEKDPGNWNFVAFAAVLLLGAVSGLISSMEKVRGGEKFNFLGTCLDILSAMFVAFIVAVACKSMALSYEYSLWLSGVASYFGTKTFKFAFRLFMKKQGIDDVR